MGFIFSLFFIILSLLFVVWQQSKRTSEYLKENMRLRVELRAFKERD